MFDVKFNLRGCLATVSFPFLALLTALLLLNDNTALLWGVLAAVAHELGHIFAMILKKCKPQQINFRAFSVDIIDTNRGQRDYNTDIFILLAGPFVNMILGILAYFMHNFFKLSWLLVLAGTNLFLAVFNLLPIEPLDGGQIVFNLLLRKMKIKNAERIVLFISFVVLLPLSILGFYVLLLSKYNFSLLFLSCYLMATLLLKNKNWYY